MLEKENWERLLWLIDKDKFWLQLQTDTRKLDDNTKGTERPHKSCIEFPKRIWDPGTGDDAESIAHPIIHGMPKMEKRTQDFSLFSLVTSTCSSH